MPSKFARAAAEAACSEFRNRIAVDQDGGVQRVVVLDRGQVVGDADPVPGTPCRCVELDVVGGLTSFSDVHRVPFASERHTRRSPGSG